MERKIVGWRIPFRATTGDLEIVRTDAGLGHRRETILRHARLTVEDGPAVLASGLAVSDFITYRRGDGVTIVPFVVATGRLIMQRKVKTAAGHAFYSFPGGMLRAGDDPAIEAARELFEETGQVADRLIRLGLVHHRPENSIDGEYLFLAFIEDLREFRGDDEEGAFLESVSRAEVENLLVWQSSELTSLVAWERAKRYLT